MEYLSSLIVFSSLYLLFYTGFGGLIIFGIIWGLDYIFNIPFIGLLQKVWGVYILGSCIFAEYRAKIAADFKVNNQVSVLQASNASISIIKSKLSFLPLIGFIFTEKSK